MSLTNTASHAYNTLVEELSLGVHPSGERLPGERQLAARLGVSRVTLRTALAALEGEGKLTREAQRGWFVPSNIVGEPPSTLQSFTEMAAARGLKATARVLRQDLRPASIEEAEKLRIAPSSTVVQIDRVRGMDGTPVCFDVVVIPHHDAARLLNVDLTDASLYDTLKDECGISVYRSAYTVMASTADTTLARLLNTSIGSAILVGNEIAYTAEGAPILLGTNRYRGDAYRFHADLYRRS